MWCVCLLGLLVPRTATSLHSDSKKALSFWSVSPADKTSLSELGPAWLPPAAAREGMDEGLAFSVLAMVQPREAPSSA